MMRLRDMPIKRKVTVVVVLTCSLVLLLACAVLAAYQMVQYRGTMLRDTTVLADVLTENTEAALAFQDESAASNKLSTLEAEPNVIGACLYSRDGRIFADYKRTKDGMPFPSSPPKDGAHFLSGILAVVRPVMLNQKRVGTLLVRSDLQAMYTRRLKLFAAVAVLVLLGSCAVALALATPVQRAITRPLVKLTDAARLIAEHKDYTIRLPAQSRDEVGLLTTAFNQLLASIGERDKALLAANESLRNGQAQLQTIVESLNEGLVVSDLDGNVQHFNRAAILMHGFSSMDECRRHVTAFADTFELSAMDGTPLPVEQWPLPRILRGENLRNLEIKVRRRQGPWRRIFNYGGTLVRDANGKPMLAVVTVNDITERKLAEQRVGEQLARLALLNQITRAIGERLDLQSVFQVVVRTLEEHLPVDFCCVCLHDAESKTLTVATVGDRSRAFAPTLGMGRNDTLPTDTNGLGRCVGGQLVYEPDVAGETHPFSKRLAGVGLRAFVAAPLLVESSVLGVLFAARHQAESFSSGECEFLRQASEHVALAAHQARLHTALQQAYDDLRQTQQTVLQQERLRALGQMASGIAHDINNAISPVGLYTESLLETEPNLSPRAREYLATIQRSIEDVAQTLTRMREFYRQRDIPLVLLPVELNPLLQQVVNLSRARWSDMPQQRGVNIELTLELTPGLPPILGVDSEIREALVNLVFNSVDAMPEGGHLTLRTKIVNRPDVAGQDTLWTAVEIVDTGAGMDEETRRRCIEPFFTTKGERGTGLGLAMVYGIAQRHGADMEIESEKGKGTTVRLVFPPAPAQHPAAPDAAPALPPARLRVLVIDDDPLLIKSLRDTLEMDGHRVVTAAGGQAGIDAFRAAQSSNEIFSVVITDLGMPYVDGRKVAAAIKAASPSTPIILLTGWGQRLVAEGNVPSHVDKVLNKPPKLRELRQALAACAPPKHESAPSHA